MQNDTGNDDQSIDEVSVDDYDLIGVLNSSQYKHPSTNFPNTSILKNTIHKKNSKLTHNSELPTQPQSKNQTINTTERNTYIDTVSNSKKSINKLNLTNGTYIRTEMGTQNDFEEAEEYITQKSKNNIKQSKFDKQFYDLVEGALLNEYDGLKRESRDPNAQIDNILISNKIHGKTTNLSHNNPKNKGIFQYNTQKDFDQAKKIFNYQVKSNKKGALGYGQLNNDNKIENSLLRKSNHRKFSQSRNGIFTSDSKNIPPIENSKHKNSRSVALNKEERTHFLPPSGFNETFQSNKIPKIVNNSYIKNLQGSIENSNKSSYVKDRGRKNIFQSKIIEKENSQILQGFENIDILLPVRNKILQANNNREDTQCERSLEHTNTKTTSYFYKDVNTPMRKMETSIYSRKFRDDLNASMSLNLNAVGQNNSTLANSKTHQIRALNRFVNNPTQNNLNRNGQNELVEIYNKFTDKELLYNLFRSGKETYSRKSHKRTLNFRPFIGTTHEVYAEPPDRGYYYKMPNGHSKIIHYVLRDNGFKEGGGKNWTIQWNVGIPKYDVFNSLNSWQKINHFPKAYEITRKDNLYMNIVKMKSRYGKAYSFIPKTYLIPSEIALLMSDHEKSKKTKLWYIAKPVCGSQGKGIFVTNDVDDIMKKFNKDLIVSRYISDPLLINGYKFDLRIYVAITCINPLRIYIYQDGLTRFATEKFNLKLDEAKDKFVHLTNFSINKNSDKFNIDDNDQDNSCKWTLSALKEKLSEMGIDVSQLWMSIEDILIKTILSIEEKLFKASDTHVPYRNCCFNLLGFDILIDAKQKPWLLEVNLNPSLGCDSGLDLRIKSKMIADLFTLIGINPIQQRDLENNKVNRNYMNNFASPYLHDTINVDNGKKTRQDDLAIIAEMRDEVMRSLSGGFKLLYPSYNVTMYKQYFEIDRGYNSCLMNEIVRNQSRVLNENFSA